MSAWKDHTTTALLGAGKTTLPALPDALRATLPELPQADPAVQFLTQAGALALWKRAGWQTTGELECVLACARGSTIAVNAAGVGHLRTMLAGRCAQVLPEWLAEVAKRGRHVPPEYVPGLLDRARQDRALRSVVLAAGGVRATWLAALNPHWSYAPVESPESWETGSREQRVAMLRAKRAAAPEEARAMVEAVWKSEPADIRTAFLSEIFDGLSTNDEPFLESVLDDRSKEVRRVAIELLARLPGSRFVARMIARVQPLVTYKRGGLLSRAALDVTLPPEPDAAALRDGLDPKTFGAQKVLGEKAVLLVLLLAAVPLSHWAAVTEADPATILKAAAKSEFARALGTGWAMAAIRQRDVAWAEALLDSETQPHTELLPAEPLVSILPEAARADRLRGTIKSGAMNSAGSATWYACLAELANFAERAPASLVREGLAALRASAAGGLPWHLRSPAETWLTSLPPSFLVEAARGWPIDQEGVSGLVELLTFRHEALTALSQP